jgi:agmatinase
MTEANFNPNDPGAADSNLFGLPYAVKQAELVVLPVTWEATVSYGAGTANGPEAILEASKQIDLYHPLIKEVWKRKMAMEDLEPELKKKSKQMRKLAEEIIDCWTNGETPSAKKLNKVNAACEEMVEYVRKKSEALLKQGKIVATLGGDHSTPLGLMKALAAKHKFGILQIDAHADLRKAYEGFIYSHASVMYNAMQEKNIVSLTQVGIRDYCEEEVQLISKSKGRIKTWYDRDIQYAKIKGTTWAAQVTSIIKALPDNVFISFDIDGLTPDHCPNTGTPVPGGLSFAEVSYLIEQVALSKKKIIGFDLNEVSPGKDDWDANVGARVLFALCCAVFINRERK